MKINIDINQIFNIDDSNRLMSDFILAYINEAKNIKSANLYNEIVKYFDLEKKYIKLFEKNHSFSSSIQKLDIDEFNNNPYNKKIILDNIKYKNYEFKYYSFSAYEGFLCDEIIVDNNYYEQTKIGYFDCEYKYLTLAKDDVIWMLISPHEINTMKNSINDAFGNVITFGLGLGYYAYMCSIKDNVNSVTIIEKDEQIISLFNKFILPQFEYKNKINIIKADAIEFLNKDDFNYDFCFIDLWHDVDDGLKLYIDTYNLSLKHKDTKFSFWIEKSMFIMIRRCIISLLYENINNIDCNEENSYYDYITNQLKNILKDYQINSYDDLKTLLSDNNIKKLIELIK